VSGPSGQPDSSSEVRLPLGAAGQPLPGPRPCVEAFGRIPEQRV